MYGGGGDCEIIFGKINCKCGKKNLFVELEVAHVPRYSSDEPEDLVLETLE